MTPTDKAAIEGLMQNWRKSATHYQIDNWQSTSPKSPDVVNAAEVAVKLCADELEQALQRLLDGETRGAVVLHELKEMWLNYPGLSVGSLSTRCIREMSPEQADFYAKACEVAQSSQSIHDNAGADKPAGVPVSELENMLRTWGNTEHYNMLIDLLDALRVLIAKYKDPHHG